MKGNAQTMATEERLAALEKAVWPDGKPKPETGEPEKSEPEPKAKAKGRR